MFVWPATAYALILGYLLGSIPFGLIFTRLSGAGDIRQVGSGGTGATNVLRTGKYGAAAAMNCVFPPMTMPARNWTHWVGSAGA
jgi:glycerol-3-phosphate acyltransferase PlsY